MMKVTCISRTIAPQQIQPAREGRLILMIRKHKVHLPQFKSISTLIQTSMNKASDSNKNFL
jgi:hypothetical protein